MIKKNVEINIGNQQYVWTSTGYDITIYKNKKIVYHETNPHHIGITSEYIKEIIIDDDL